MDMILSQIHQAALFTAYLSRIYLNANSVFKSFTYQKFCGHFFFKLCTVYQIQCYFLDSQH